MFLRTGTSVSFINALRVKLSGQNTKVQIVGLYQINLSARRLINTPNMLLYFGLRLIRALYARGTDA